MKILYLILAFTCCILFSCCCYLPIVLCDQPVFVLETSDSSEGPSSPSSSFQTSEQPSSSSSLSSTHVITDDDTSTSSDHHNNAANHKQNKPSQVVVIDRHHASTSTTTHNPATNHQPEHNQQLKQQAHSATSSGEHHNGSKPQELNHNNSKEPSAARRLDETPAHVNQKLPNNRNSVAQHSKPPKSTQTSTTTTTTTTTTLTATSSPTTPQSGYEQPKTEERLLISITSDEDEYRPPKRQVIASTGGFDEIETAPTTALSQQQPQHHKKRPAITISIQDNSNKQGGNSGAPSVILKPSENGQSIIISTLGSSSIETNNNNNDNKYNPNKPAISIGTNGQINNNNYEQPYREPVNNGYPSSTHRPLISNNHNNNNHNNNDQYNPPANRPVVSTLVDQPRPPINIMTQRPPINVNPNEDYDSRPSTHAPTHSRPTTGRPPPADYQNENTGDLVPPSSQTSPSNNKQSKYPLNEESCGVNYKTRIVGGDEADPNDFLWMSAIIKSRATDGDVKPFCGGSLITRRHILTAAHCLEGLAPRDVLVRLGSYDFDDSTASTLSYDYAIDQFRKPAQYNKKTHVADIAIMRLKTPLQASDNYKTVCMPQARRSYVGALGTVTGYGSQSQTFRRAAPKLRQVTVPIWENRRCATMYKKNLTESFLCAGYEEGGKDACQGDSGGPLMVEGPNSQTIVVGVVSHGIGCGSPGYPGVYTRISTFLDWIEENTRE